jgi:hypothetical protein
MKGEVLEKGKREQDEAMKHPDVLGAGAKKRKKLRNKEDKIAVVMREFKRGTLRSGSGKKVTDRKQALAIALAEAGVGKNKALSPSEVQQLLKSVELGSSYTYASKVSDALYVLSMLCALVSKEDIERMIENLKAYIAFIPAGEIKNIIVENLDKLKNIQSMDDAQAGRLKDVVITLIRSFPSISTMEVK